MSEDAQDRLGAPPRYDELTQLQETRRPESDQDTVRELGFDPYTAPELQAISSMSGTNRVQRIVALVLLLVFVFAFVVMPLL